MSKFNDVKSEIEAYERKLKDRTLSKFSFFFC